MSWSGALLEALKFLAAFVAFILFGAGVLAAIVLPGLTMDWLSGHIGWPAAIVLVLIGVVLVVAVLIKLLGEEQR